MVLPPGLWLAGTLLFALVLEVYPWNIFAIGYRPQWLLLVVVFWCLKRPHEHGVMTAFLAGLLLDILIGGLIGRYAISFCVTVFLLKAVQQRLHHSTVAHLSVLVFLLALVNNLVSRMTDQWVSAVSMDTQAVLVSALLTAACWPLVQMPMQRVVRAE